MRTLMYSTALLFLLWAAPPPAQAQSPAPDPDSRVQAGRVGTIDLVDRTLRVGVWTFVVPLGVADLSQIPRGAQVVVRYTQSGDDRIASEIQIIPEPPS
jgi:hypothetical protein